MRCRSATTFRRGHLFDQTHPCYAGDLGIGPNPKLLERIKSADLVILLGGRLGELPSQSYTLFDIPRPQVPFVHVHPGAEELGRVYSPQLAINATPTAFAAALEDLQFAAEARGRRQGGATPIICAWTETPTEQPGGVNFGAVMVWLRENLPPMPFSATAPAIMPPGFIASSASAVSRSMSRRPRARWAMACRPRWR